MREKRLERTTRERERGKKAKKLRDNEILTKNGERERERQGNRLRE